MRFSTLLSFILALGLAGAAVFGAQTWLAQERAQINSAPAQEAAPVEKNTIVVAAEAITFGERMNAAKLREIEWASDALPEGAYPTIDDLIVGDTDEEARFSLTSISPGEPILASKVTEPGQRAKMSTTLTPGMVAAAIRVNDVNGVAGFVLPGDRVNILLTRKGKYAETLLQGIKVLAIDQIADDRKDKPSVVRTVTFEVTEQQSLKLVLAASVGSMSLTLRQVASNAITENERITFDDLFGEVDVAPEVIEGMAAELLAEEGPDPDDERFASLEELLENLGSNVDRRLADFEKKIQAPEPVIVDREVEVVVEKPAPIIVPRNSTVGVIRNGKRNEYKVKTNKDGELVIVENNAEPAE